jgi:hypothetical protein
MKNLTYLECETIGAGLSPITTAFAYATMVTGCNLFFREPTDLAIILFGVTGVGVGLSDILFGEQL